MKTMTGYGTWFVVECERAAREADKSLRETGCAEHYLWYKTLSLVVAQERPSEEYQLATPERVPGNLTLLGLTGWINDRSARLPILPPG